MTGSLMDILKPAQALMLRIAEQERSAYLAYWSKYMDAHDQPIVADVGYSGSIQRQLSRLSGSALGGAYFAVKPEIGQIIAEHGWAEARFHDGRIHASSSPVMQFHMLLESVLTSPDGQFSYFETTSSGLKARHRVEPGDAGRWAVIERIHAGALHFAQDIISVAQTDTLQLHFDRDLVQEPLRCVGTRLWELGNWAAPLTVEDRYTGRGQVSTRSQAH
jgi:hypothetical protein